MFFQKVYKKVKYIPKGKVTTYKAITNALEEPEKQMAVGWALHANRDNANVPCHRVVNQKGELANGFAFGGPEGQKSLLEKEGVIVKTLIDKNGEKQYIVDLHRYFWNPMDHDKIF